MEVRISDGTILTISHDGIVLPVLKLKEKLVCAASLDALDRHVVFAILEMLLDLRDVVCLATTCRRLRRIIREGTLDLFQRRLASVDWRVYHMLPSKMCYDQYVLVNSAIWRVKTYFGSRMHVDLASLDEVVAAEKHLGHRFPEEYRACILNRFNGLRFPAFIMMALTKSLAWREFPNSTLLPIARQGGVIVYLLDLTNGTVVDPLEHHVVASSFLEFVRRSELFY